MKITKAEKKLAFNDVKKTCKRILDDIARFEILKGENLDLGDVHDEFVKLLIRLQEFYSPRDAAFGEDGEGGALSKLSPKPKTPGPAMAKPIPVQ